MLGATVLVSEFGSARAGVPSTPALWIAILLVAVVTGLHLRGSYAARVGLHLLEDLRVVVVTTAFAAMAVLSLRVLLLNDPYVAAQTARLWVFATVYLAAGRVALGWSELAARRRGDVAKPTLVIGAGRVGRLVARRLLERPEFGLRPVGFLDKEPLHDLPGSPDLPVLGASWDLAEIVEEHGVEHVVVTFSTAPHPVLLRTIQECQDRGVDVTFVPRLYEKVTERMTVERLGGIPLLVARATNPRAWQFRVKHVVDRIVAATLLFLTLPAFAAVALAVRVSLGRPVFFRQARVGRDGRAFEMLKFRSMRPDVGNASHDYSADESVRLTPLGEFLRKTSLDELPQLVNVVRGEMSLVGPRPERPELVELFEETVYRYGDRNRVKAGITGWAQVHGIGRGADRFAGLSLADRAEWDNYYIENWYLWLDLKIVLMTIGAVLRFRQPT
jgi:exopolysaccharide biosynthesis polyprenyl glycosylphosphotransferase